MTNSILFPPVHVFPRNPDIASWVNPVQLYETFVEGSDKNLIFETGVNGTTNTIRTTSPIYIDYSQYNYRTKQWGDKPIELTVQGASSVTDITNYFKREVISFPQMADTPAGDIIFYFDGEKIITNYNFNNPVDRAKVSVMYYKLLDSIRVKAVMVTNSTGMITQTPTIDQYTLVMGQQKPMY